MDFTANKFSKKKIKCYWCGFEFIKYIPDAFSITPTIICPMCDNFLKYQEARTDKK